MTLRLENAGNLHRHSPPPCNRTCFSSISQAARSKELFLRLREGEKKKFCRDDKTGKQSGIHILNLVVVTRSWASLNKTTWFWYQLSSLRMATPARCSKDCCADTTLNPTGFSETDRTLTFEKTLHEAPEFHTTYRQDKNPSGKLHICTSSLKGRIRQCTCTLISTSPLG